MPVMRTNGKRRWRGQAPCLYCTLAITDALPLMVKVQVLTLLLPLEHAPDQMASRPLLTLKVIELLLANPADCVLPTATLMPAGLEVIRSPLRPLAVPWWRFPAATRPWPAFPPASPCRRAPAAPASA